METQATEEITLRIDKQIAQAYKVASGEERRKFQILVNLSLKEAEEDTTSLEEIVHEASQTAKAKIKPS